MKFSTILVIGLILLTCVNTIVNASVLDNEHYIICGHVYEPYTHDTVMIENTRTSEVLEIKLQQFEPNKKEYQVTIANFELGWKWSDIVTITYGNQTLPIELIEGDIGAQIDFNRPTDIEPTTVLAGTILILSASGLYYRIIKRKGDTNMTEIETDTTEIVPKTTVWTPLNIAIIVMLAGVLLCIAAFIASGRPIPTVHGYETDILMIAAAFGAAFYQINGYFVAKRNDPAIEWGDGYTIKTLVAAITIALTLGATPVTTLTLYNVFGALLAGLGGNVLISKTVK